jgi:hypothetical protein
MKRLEFVCYAVGWWATLTQLIHVLLLRFYETRPLQAKCDCVNDECHINTPRVEAGSNTFTVTLRVVRGDEMCLKRPRHSLNG